ncbi:MAG: hypothetical protein ACRCZF_21520 [Gemmataceae bacterium]
MNEELYSGDEMTCPLEMVCAVKHTLFQTLEKCLGRTPCGDDILSALHGRPAHWLVPLMLELSWTGIDTSHCVIDAKGFLTGQRVWLEEACEEDGLSPHPDYSEVQIGICGDGSVVMTLDGSPPTGAWQSFVFAIHNRELDTLLDDEIERQLCIGMLDGYRTAKQS